MTLHEIATDEVATGTAVDETRARRLMQRALQLDQQCEIVWLPKQAATVQSWLLETLTPQQRSTSLVALVRVVVLIVVLRGDSVEALG